MSSSSSPHSISGAWRSVLASRGEQRFLQMPVAEASQFVTFRFSSFFKRAAKLAGALRDDCKLSAGQAVAILSESPQEFALMTHACWLADLTVVPIPLAMPEPTAVAIMNNCGVGLALFSLENAARIASLTARLPEIKHWVVAGTSARVPLGREIRRFDDLLAGGDEIDPPTELSGEPALVVPTRGSEGAIRGVSFSQEQLLASVSAAAAHPLFATKLANGDPKTIWSTLQPKCLPTMLYSLLLPLVSPTAALLSFDAGQELWEQFAANSVNLAMVDQVTLRNLVLRGKSRRWVKPDQFEMLVVPTSRVPRSVAAAFQQGFGVPLHHAYVESEAGGIVSIESDPGHSYGQEAIDDVASAGAPLPGIELRLRNGEGSDVPPGTLGEIAVRSAGLMSGYNGTLPGDASFGHGGFLHTGDNGFLLNGKLYVTGRTNEVVEHKGALVNLAEIEAALYQVRGVQRCWAVHFPHRANGKELGALVVASAGTGLTEAQIRAQLVQWLKIAEVPKVVVVAKPQDIPAMLSKEELLQRFAPYGNIKI